MCSKAWSDCVMFCRMFQIQSPTLAYIFQSQILILVAIILCLFLYLTCFQAHTLFFVFMVQKYWPQW